MRVLSGNGELVVPLPSAAPEFAYAARFENWVESLQSEVEHSRFLGRRVVLMKIWKGCALVGRGI